MTLGGIGKFYLAAVYILSIGKSTHYAARRIFYSVHYK